MNSEYSIDNLNKILNTDIKNILEMKYNLGLNISLQPSQISILDKLRVSLNNIRQDFLKDKEILLNKKYDKYINDILDIENILYGHLDKEITLDMFKSLYEVVDFRKEESLDILRSFYDMGIILPKKITFTIDDVVSLYKKYLPEYNYDIEDENSFINLLYKYKSEILNFFDINNAKEILEFFKDNNILENFEKNAIFQITLYAKYQNVTLIYNRLKESGRLDNLEFYTTRASTIWIESIKKKKTTKRSHIKGRENNSKESKLYNSCHGTNLDDYDKNLSLLNNSKIKNMFISKNAINTKGAHTALKMIDTDTLKENLSLCNMLYTSNWLFEKNIGLFHLFGFGIMYRLSPKVIYGGDMEDKINMAIELGLLNPPMNEEYLDLESNIIRNENFKKNNEGYNISIRDYFQRYSSYFFNMDFNEFIYLTYKMSIMKPLEFYNFFFSKKSAGQQDPHKYKKEEIEIMNNRDKMNTLVQKNFANYEYRNLIDNYEEYAMVIDNNPYNYVSEEVDIKPYYSKDILEDEAVVLLDNTYTTYDMLINHGNYEKLKNNFVYLFNGRIISRMRVLHNLSILKKHYGLLNKDMVVASFAKGSYLTKDNLIYIKNAIEGLGISDELFKRI